jgi:hypothetical protein
MSFAQPQRHRLAVSAVAFYVGVRQVRQRL